MEVVYDLPESKYISNIVEESDMLDLNNTRDDQYLYVDTSVLTEANINVTTRAAELLKMSK